MRTLALAAAAATWYVDSTVEDAGDAAVLPPDVGAWELCPWDLTGDGRIGASDMLAPLAAWAQPADGPPELDGDGIVGIADLLDMLLNWSGCG